MKSGRPSEREGRAVPATHNKLGCGVWCGVGFLPFRFCRGLICVGSMNDPFRGIPVNLPKVVLHADLVRENQILPVCIKENNFTKAEQL